jgi:aminoglycoside phosphotransferase (APT) family kinase protein
VTLAPLRTGLTALRLEVIAGQPAANLLSRRPARLLDVLEQLADWLQRWGVRTRRPARADSQRLAVTILAPASALAPTFDIGGRYLTWLHERCEAVLGDSLPLVAVHNDLSMVNVLLDGSRTPGIVDWERASSSGLPLTDYFYAAADALAATRAYRHRPEALQISFDPSTDYGRVVDKLARRLAEAFGLSVAVTELLRHATLLHHAANEQARSRTESRPFGEAVQWLACRALGISSAP